MIPVVLGVLIALFIGNYQQQRENQFFLEHVFASIEHELIENQSELGGIIPLQEALEAKLMAAAENDSVSVSDIVIESSGFPVATIKNISWQSFLQSKIELVDYQTIAKLSAIDDQLAFSKLRLSKLMDLLYEHSEATDRTHKRMVAFQIANLVESEQALLLLYQEYLNLKAHY